MGIIWKAGQFISDRYELREKFGNNIGRQTWLTQDLAFVIHRNYVGNGTGY